MEGGGRRIIIIYRDVFGRSRHRSDIFYRKLIFCLSTTRCTTRRFKRCRLKEVCGNEVLREVAYCYTEGSFCEEWIVRQMYSNVPRSPGAQMVQQNQVANEQQQQQPPQQPPISRNSNSFQERKLPTRATGIAPGPGQCGIATAVSNRRKPASHMLRIIGGRVVRRGSYPWQVAILNRFKVRLN